MDRVKFESYLILLSGTIFLVLNISCFFGFRVCRSDYPLSISSVFLLLCYAVLRKHLEYRSEFMGIFSLALTTLWTFLSFLWCIENGSNECSNFEKISFCIAFVLFFCITVIFVIMEYLLIRRERILQIEHALIPNEGG